MLITNEGEKYEFKNKINISMYHSHYSMIIKLMSSVCNAISGKCHDFVYNICILCFSTFQYVIFFLSRIENPEFSHVRTLIQPCVYLDKFPMGKCFLKLIQILLILIWKHICVNSRHQSYLCANKLSNILVIYLLWKYC